MPVTEVRRRANRKYDSKTYEPLNFNVLKGEKAIVAGAAKEQGLSLAAYVRAAIAEKMERDGVPEEKRITASISGAKRPEKADETGYGDDDSCGE